jgi:hypothetical protein
VVDKNRATPLLYGALCYCEFLKKKKKKKKNEAYVYACDGYTVRMCIISVDQRIQYEDFEKIIEKFT